MSDLVNYLDAIAKMQEGNPGLGEAYYKWILKNGRLFTEREDARKFCKNFNRRANGCYFNAQVLSIDNKELKYYEGWGITKKVGIPMEHGFNVINGKIVDITWEDGIEYFGLEVSIKFVMNEMVKEKTAHPVLFRWWMHKTGRKL